MQDGVTKRTLLILGTAGDLTVNADTTVSSSVRVPAPRRRRAQPTRGAPAD